MSTHTQARRANQGPPNSINWRQACGLQIVALNAGIKGFIELLCLSMIFVCVVGPVFVGSTFVTFGTPNAAIVVASHVLLAISSYIAYIACAFILIVRGKPGNRPRLLHALSERWPQLRREALIALSFGSLILLLAEVAERTLDLQTLGITSAPLSFFATTGAALMIIAGHVASCMHMPQLHLIAREVLDEQSAHHLAERASARYGVPVVSGVIALALLGLLCASYAPVMGLLVWLQTVWYSHATLLDAWQPRSQRHELA